MDFLKKLLIGISVCFAATVLLSGFISFERETQFLSLGYPFEFYYQFKIRGNEGLNFGSRPDYFVYDLLIVSAVVFFLIISIRSLRARLSARAWIF